MTPSVDEPLHWLKPTPRIRFHCIVTDSYTDTVPNGKAQDTLLEALPLDVKKWFANRTRMAPRPATPAEEEGLLAELIGAEQLRSLRAERCG